VIVFFELSPAIITFVAVIMVKFSLKKSKCYENNNHWLLLIPNNFAYNNIQICDSTTTSLAYNLKIPL